VGGQRFQFLELLLLSGLPLLLYGARATSYRLVLVRATKTGNFATSGLRVEPARAWQLHFLKRLLCQRTR
jgi:hypothetical protein